MVDVALYSTGSGKQQAKKPSDVFAARRHPLVGYFHAAPSFARLLHLEPGRDGVPEESERELVLRLAAPLVSLGLWLW